MADNKKSVLLYCDLIHTVEKLTNSQAGKLFKHYLRYVNDLEPETDDVLIDLVFEPIKQGLKRDLKKWEGIKVKRSEAGKKSAEIRKQKQQVLTSVESVEQTSTNPTVSVSDSDSVTVSEIIDKSITYNKKEFLQDWNTLRKKFTGKDSFLNRLPYQDLKDLKEILEVHTPDDIRGALEALFRQAVLPGDNKLMKSNPSHFLFKFNSYITAFHDKNTELYGKKEIHKL